jgi:hypothetical protein
MPSMVMGDWHQPIDSYRAWRPEGRRVACHLRVRKDEVGRGIPTRPTPVLILGGTRGW